MGSKKEFLKREKDIINKLGLETQPGSGSGEMFKEDGRTTSLLGQMKSTKGKGIRIDKEILKKLVYNARISHKKPFLLLDYIGHSQWIAARPMDLYDVANEIDIKMKSKGGDENTHLKYEIIGRIFCGELEKFDDVVCYKCNEMTFITNINQHKVEFDCGHIIKK